MAHFLEVFVPARSFLLPYHCCVFVSLLAPGPLLC